MSTQLGHGSKLAVPTLAAGDLVLCDFDGTITLEDTGLAMIRALGDARAWELETKWRRGEINSCQCLCGQWGLLDWGPERFAAFVASLALDTTFGKLWETVLRRRARLLILSDGLDLYLDPLMARLGYQVCPGEAVLAEPFGCCVPRFVNHAFFRQGRVQLTFPYRSPTCVQCANCKLGHLARLRPYFRRIIYVGDGPSDLCPAQHADVVFAKGDLAELLAERGVPFLSFVTLGDVARMLAADAQPPGFEILNHTADYALRARGADLAELIANAARGMVTLMAEVEGLQPANWLEVAVEAESAAELVHHALRALLHIFEDGALPVAIEVLRAQPHPPRAALRVGTAPLAAVRDRLRGEIKAVTYHNLHIRQEDGYLVTEIVFDT
jgi:2-hydroxy-3-keto-5-methylthiopentenyl-1-phosphate phosphatase